MSLYNKMHGINPIFEDLMAILGLTKVGRLRDVHLLKDRIRILTRNGGNNKIYGFGENSSRYNCISTRRCRQCIGCLMFDILPKHPNFIREYDSMMDPTFAYIEFSIPEHIDKKLLEMLRAKQPDTMNLQEKMEDFKSNPDKYKKQIESVAKEIQKGLNGGVNIIRM